MSAVRHQNATCRYPRAERPSVTNLDLQVADGEFLVVTIGIRPEGLHPAADGEGPPIVADVVEEFGADAFAHGHLFDAVTGRRLPD